MKRTSEQGKKKETTRKATRKNAWGSQSYADLISEAIESSPLKKMTLAQIYEYIIRNVPHFKDKGDSKSSSGWKNSIRHNLSLHNRFQRIPADDSDNNRSSYWKLNPDAGSSSTPRRRNAQSRKKGRAKFQHQLTFRSQLQAQEARSNTLQYASIHQLTSKNNDFTLRSSYINSTSSYSSNSSTAIALEYSSMNWKTLFPDTNIRDRNFNQGIQFYTDLDEKSLSTNCGNSHQHTDGWISQNLNSLEHPVLVNLNKHDFLDMNNQNLISKNYDNHESKTNCTLNRDFSTTLANISLNFDDNNSKEVSCQEQIARNTGIECFRSAHHLNGGVVTTNISGFANRSNDIIDEILEHTLQCGSDSVKLSKTEENENSGIIESIFGEKNETYALESKDDTTNERNFNSFQKQSGLNINPIQESALNLEQYFETNKDKKRKYFNEDGISTVGMVHSEPSNCIETHEERIGSKILPKRPCSTFKEEISNNKMEQNISKKYKSDMPCSLDYVVNIFSNDKENTDEFSDKDITSNVDLWTEDIAFWENDDLNCEVPVLTNSQNQMNSGNIYPQINENIDGNLKNRVTFLVCDQEIDKEIENIRLKDCSETGQSFAETFVSCKLNVTDIMSSDLTFTNKENPPLDNTHKCESEVMKDIKIENYIFKNNKKGENSAVDDIALETEKLYESLTNDDYTFKMDEDKKCFKMEEFFNDSNILLEKEDCNLEIPVLSNSSGHRDTTLPVNDENLNKEKLINLDITVTEIPEFSMINQQDMLYQNSKESEYFSDDSNRSAKSDLLNGDFSVNYNKELHSVIMDDPDLNVRNESFKHIFNTNNASLTPLYCESNFVDNETCSSNDILSASNLNIANVSPSHETEWCFANNALFPDMNLRNEETDHENIGRHILKIGTDSINCSEESQDTIIIDMTDFSSDNETCDFACHNSISKNQDLHFTDTFSKDSNVTISPKTDIEREVEEWNIKTIENNYDENTLMREHDELNILPENNNSNTISEKLFDDDHTVMDFSFYNECNVTVLDINSKNLKDNTNKKTLLNKCENLDQFNASLGPPKSSIDNYEALDIQKPCSSTQNFPIECPDIDTHSDLLQMIVFELSYNLLDVHLPMTTSIEKENYTRNSREDSAFYSLNEFTKVDINLDYKYLNSLKNILESSEMKDSYIEKCSYSIRSEESEDSGIFDVGIFSDDDDDSEEIHKRLHTRKE